MKKKIKSSLKDLLNKRENLAIMAVALVFCVGVAVNGVRNGKIPLHDGDVLVDSRTAVTEEAGDSAENAPETEAKTPTDEKGGVFAANRAALELERNDMLAQYDQTIKDASSEAEKNNASAQKKKLIGYMEQEIAVEGIILSKNLPESFVIITEKSVTVTVDDKDLDQNTVAKICSVVMTETGRTADKIIIQSRY